MKLAGHKFKSRHRPMRRCTGSLTRVTQRTLIGSGQGETPISASFDAANRMTAITLNPGSTSAKTYSLSYDQNGNLTQKQNTTDANDNTRYTWDSANRLTQISQSAATGTVLTASFSYDAFGRRIQSTLTQGGQGTQTPG